jgi:hypothetical protein
MYKHFMFYIWKPSWIFKVQAWLVYPLWVMGMHSKDFQIHLFLHFSHDMSYISPFFISNEIILFQILYKPIKHLFFSLMKVRIIKIIQYGPCLSMAQNSEIFDFLKLFTLQWNIWLLSHSYILYTLTHKVFVVKILGQKIPYESLNFFSSWNKVLDFFQGVRRNLWTCSNLTFYA